MTSDAGAREESPAESPSRADFVGMLRVAAVGLAAVYLLVGTVASGWGTVLVVSGAIGVVASGIASIFYRSWIAIPAPLILWVCVAATWWFWPTYGPGGAVAPGLGAPGPSACAGVVLACVVPLIIALWRLRWWAAGLVPLAVWALLPIVAGVFRTDPFEDFPLVDGFWGDLPTWLEPAQVLVVFYLPTLLIVCAVAPWVGTRRPQKVVERIAAAACWGGLTLVTLVLCVSAMRSAHIPSSLWPAIDGVGETTLHLEDGTPVRVATTGYDALGERERLQRPRWRMLGRAMRSEGAVVVWLTVLDERGRDVLDRDDASFEVFVSGQSPRRVSFRSDLQEGPPSYAPPNLWIANSKENTISKISTRTGEELGRYATPVDPSRTAVDLSGDVYVAARERGEVTKILAAGCEGASCVSWTVQTCAGARGLAVARDGFVWVGGVRPGRVGCIQKLDPDNGKVLFDGDLPGSVYGLALDQRGHIWAVSQDRGGAIYEMDSRGNLQGRFEPPEGAALYGIAIGPQGRVWLGNNTSMGIWRFDPQTTEWARFVSGGPGGHSRGIAADTQGNIWVANSSTGTVSRFAAESGEWLGDFSSGGSGPVGVAIDGDQRPWVINQDSANASRLDPETGVLLGTFPTGAGPYTYSDMTGYALFNFVAADGTYQLTWGDGSAGGIAP